MKKLTITLLLFLSFLCYAQDPERIEIGIYINRIDSFDIKNGTANIDFWLWGRREGNDTPILSTLEISNGQILQAGELIEKKQGGLFYEARRYNAIIFCNVELNKFPFDKQVLKICVEDSELLADQMIFFADKKNSRLDPNLSLPEWDISPIRCFSDIHSYPTSFGDPDVKEEDEGGQYSRLNIEIDLNRKGDFVSKFFKYFWATIVSVAVGLAALGVRVSDCAARFGTTVGALFANVGCSFIISDKLPESSELTIAEFILFISLGVILLLLLESIISLWFYNRKKSVFSRRMDIFSFVTVAIIYSASILLVIYR